MSLVMGLSYNRQEGGLRVKTGVVYAVVLAAILATYAVSTTDVAGAETVFNEFLQMVSRCLYE